MSETILISLIAAVPPTLAALAALWQVHKISKPIDDVNRAVNHRSEGQRTLIETVDAIAQHVERIEQRLERHLAYHQEELEDDAF